MRWNWLRRSLRLYCILSHDLQGRQAACECMQAELSSHLSLKRKAGPCRLSGTASPCLPAHYLSLCPNKSAHMHAGKHTFPLFTNLKTHTLRQTVPVLNLCYWTSTMQHLMWWTLTCNIESATVSSCAMTLSTPRLESPHFTSAMV
jgi:hypothetical protein